MGKSDAEWTAWAAQHRAAFEVAPLIELHKGEKVQVGFTLTLHASIPMEKAPGEERQAAARAVRNELHALMEDAVPAQSRKAGVDLEPPRTAVLRPENEFRPEVSLTWRVFHAEEFWKPVTAGDRERLAQVEKRLAAMGLKHGHW